MDNSNHEGRREVMAAVGAVYEHIDGCTDEFLVSCHSISTSCIHVTTEPVSLCSIYRRVPANKIWRTLSPKDARPVANVKGTPN
jgi:hypothetical protein